MEANLKEKKVVNPTLKVLKQIENNTSRIAAALEVLAKNSDRTTGNLSREYGGAAFVRTLTIQD